MKEEAPHIAIHPRQQQNPELFLCFLLLSPSTLPPSVATNQPRSAELDEKRHEEPAARVGQRRRDALGVKVLAALASCQPPPPYKEYNIRFPLCQEEPGKKNKRKQKGWRKEREKGRKKRKIKERGEKRK